MRHKSLTAMLLVPAVAIAAAVQMSRSEPVPPGTAAAAAARPSPQLLGIVSDARQRRLAEVDPDTLRPRPGPQIDVGSEGCASRSGGQACWGVPPWSFSPDRSLVAVARHDGGVVRSLRLVDVARMRVTVDVPIAGGAVGLLAWPARGRVLAVQEICCDERQQLVVVDVARRRVAARRGLEGTVQRVGRTPRELVLLVAPAQDIGAARLALVDSRGRLRFVGLARMLAGTKALGRLDFRVERPGLAVDPAGRRAFVVGRDLVADVDLTSLAVSYHELLRPTSLLARVRAWLDPVAYAKGASGPMRVARWLGDGLLAVAGADEDQTRVRPAGLSLVDTRDWSVRMVDRGATDVRVASGLLLATGQEDAGGLTAYSLAGETRFRLFDGRRAWIEQVYDGRAYVGLSGDGRRVVDLAAGRTTRERVPSLPWLLLDAALGWWDG